MSETVYVKRGRRYVPFSRWERATGDEMKVGTFRLTYAYADGCRRYAYNVNPELGLSPHEQQAVALLGADTRRDLYEGAAADGRSGSGNFWITHTADEKYSPFAKREVLALQQRGLIVEKWPGCYTTPRNLAAHPLKA